MRKQRNELGRWRVICLVLLFALIAGCSGDKGQPASPPGQVGLTQPYDGPCPEGQASWDCMAWNEDNWE